MGGGGSLPFTVNNQLSYVYMCHHIDESGSVKVNDKLSPTNCLSQVDFCLKSMEEHAFVSHLPSFLLFLVNVTLNGCSKLLSAGTITFL